MAEEVQHQHQHKKSDEPCFSDATDAAPKAAEAVESTDRGLFGFGGKKEEKKCEEGAIAAEFGEKAQVSEGKKDEEKKHESLLDKLHRSGSSSSSSSEEEVEENGEKKKKKKDKKKKEEENKPTQETEEKKGFLDRIKEKLPGGKKAEEVASPPPTPATATECAAAPEAEEKEKKGFLDKIKEKIPGYGPAKTDDEKGKEKEAANH